MRLAAKANKQTGSVDDKDVGFGVVIVLVIEAQRLSYISTKSKQKIVYRNVRTQSNKNDFIYQITPQFVFLYLRVVLHRQERRQR